MQSSPLTIFKICDSIVHSQLSSSSRFNSTVGAAEAIKDGVFLELGTFFRPASKKQTTFNLRLASICRKKRDVIIQWQEKRNWKP